MTDTNEKEKKPGVLQLSNTGKLQLSQAPAGAQQKPGMSSRKTVTVEVRKSRSFSRNDGGTLVEIRKAPGGLTESQVRVAKKAVEEDDALTEGEKQARLRALKGAEENAKARELLRKQRTAEPEPEETEESEPGAGAPSGGASTVTINPIYGAMLGGKPVKAKEPAAAETVVRPKDKKSDIVLAPARNVGRLGGTSHDDEETESAEAAANRLGKLRPRRGDASRRDTGKITVTQALSMSDEQPGRQRSMASIRRQREKFKRVEHKEQEKVFREVVVPEAITVQELANRMSERAVDVVKFLMKMGTMVTVTQSIDADTAELIVTEFGHKVKRVTEGDVENILTDAQDDPATLKPRAPVVTIMGHVDHGKTSLLDALRHTDVVAGEAGGITQHIGAYQVTLNNGSKITFLDTPGHEAFTAMRARGSKVTDIVVLVVAADDGIMEQTKEAINHAKAANVPIIVAVNKIDKPDANAQRVRAELMQYGLVPEDLGGDVQVVEVSAKQGTNLDKLQEAILVQAEVLELTANFDRMAMGVVIEAKVDKGRGPVASLLIQKGTIRVGDIVVAGSAAGRVRALLDDKGKNIESAGPSMPIEILGLDSVPDAGAPFSVVENEKTARDISEYRQKQFKKSQATLSARSLDQLFAASGVNAVKELPVIIKADVQGSVEAIIGSLMKFSGEEVSVKVVHSAVGGITESDVTLAQTTGAIIIAFNVRATIQARDMAAREKIDIRYYSVIYDVVDEVKAALSGLLSPHKKEKFLGYAEIRQVFNITKHGKIGGCMVTEGMVKRGAKVRLLRDNVVIHEGTLKTLKRFKDDVKEVKAGFECGMAFENYEDIRENDMIEAFEIEEVARTV